MPVIDLVLGGFVMLFLEKRILKEKYILFSPYTITVLAFLYVYVMPFFFLSLDDSVNNIIRLASEQGISKTLLYVRLFFYSWCIFAIISLFKIRNRDFRRENVSSMFSKDFVIIMSLAFTSIIIITQLMIVKFDIPLFIDKLINPRLYTYYKEGIGPLTYFIEVAKKLLLFIAIVHFYKEKGIQTALLLSIAVFLNILGGTKTSIVITIIFFVLVVQKFSKNEISISFNKTIRYVIVLGFVVIMAFMFMTTTSRWTFNTAVGGVISYSQEAYYTSRVLVDFQAGSEHVKESIKSFILSPVPRAIFEGKSYYGFYANYWRPLYQPNTVVYHTSTYGLLSEGHMMFGIAAPFIYAFLINILLHKIYQKYFTSNNMTSVFICFFLISQLYFFIRSGLFDATFLWSIILHFIGAKLVFLLMRSREERFAPKTCMRSPV